MLTYAGINLTTKKFQVGSTTDFERRYGQHLKSEDNPEFHNSLRKDPSNFFWLISEDDGLDTREEEQFYLNFYFGTQWCYNLNPSANSPPNRKGAEWSEESKNKLKETQRNLDFVWVNDGKNAFRVPREESEGYEKGRGNTYNNGVCERVSVTHPGEGWTLGQLPSHKVCPESRKKFGSDNHASIPVYLKHETWEEERRFESISIACRTLGLHKSCLLGVLKGKRKQHKGFTARYT